MHCCGPVIEVLYHSLSLSLWLPPHLRPNLVASYAASIVCDLYRPRLFVLFKPSVPNPNPNPNLNLHPCGRVVDELADSAREASAKKGASDETRDRVEAQAKEGRELLGELLRTVAALLASGPVHREEFLQVSL